MAQAVRPADTEAQRRLTAERLHGLYADVAPGRKLVDEMIAEGRSEDRESETYSDRRGR